MNDNQLRTLIYAVTDATTAGKLNWRAAGPDFVTQLETGTVRVSAIVGDQRDGDFGYFTITDSAGKVVATTTIQPALYRLIAGGPGKSIADAMLAELRSL